MSFGGGMNPHTIGPKRRKPRGPTSAKHCATNRACLVSLTTRVVEAGARAVYRWTFGRRHALRETVLVVAKPSNRAAGVVMNNVTGAKTTLRSGCCNHTPPTIMWCSVLGPSGHEVCERLHKLVIPRCSKFPG
jgi:hypothetical protein